MCVGQMTKNWIGVCKYLLWNKPKLVPSASVAAYRQTLPPCGSNFEGNYYFYRSLKSMSAINSKSSTV